VCGWQVKLCDPLVTHGPYLSALEIKSLYIKCYINSAVLHIPIKLHQFMISRCSVFMLSGFASTDVTIIESEIKIEFFLKNRIESKSIFWLVFVIDFDSRLYWRIQCTAASSKNDS